MNNSDDIQNLTQNAIKAAVTKKWQEAVETNEKILELSSNDIPTLNRLGIAYSMIGKQSKASSSFKKVLELDPKNQIAKNNLTRLRVVKDQGLINSQVTNIFFVEEPGKSKVIPLVSIGEPTVLSSLNIGEPVEITPNKHKIKVCSQKQQFIGYLPDNISHRLLQLFKGGYKYRGFMKSINPKAPFVFIQETYSSKKLKGLLSFPLDDNEMLPNLSAGESSETPPLEIYDPEMGSEE